MTDFTSGLLNISRIEVVPEYSCRHPLSYYLISLMHLQYHKVICLCVVVYVVTCVTSEDQLKKQIIFVNQFEIDVISLLH